MDSYVPIYKGEAMFGRCTTHEIWNTLLEKAWAKSFGGYFNIETGLARDVLRDLTSASCKTFFLDHHSN